MHSLIELDNDDGRPTFILSVFHKKFQMIKVALQKYPCKSSDYFQKLCIFFIFINYSRTLKD